MNQKALTALLDLFNRMLKDPKPAINDRDLSEVVEYFATWLFSDDKSRWYDGAAEIRWHKRKQTQIVVEGTMWVGDGGNQWLEPFRLTITDKRSTKLDIVALMRIGEHEAEAKLLFALDDAARIDKDRPA